MTTPRQPLVNDFVNRSFRDVADQDYLAARILYRYGLGLQFLWSALQPLEKYFKAILLYNGRSTKNLDHNIVAAFNRVQAIDDIPFDFPEDIETFIKYLNQEGGNRYFEHPSYCLGEQLLLPLDRTVWHVRRYCYYMRRQIKKKNGEVIDLFPHEIKRIQSQAARQAHNVRLFGGYLEKVLDQRGSKLRQHLVWKNFYYGAYKKRFVKNYGLHSWLLNPTHYIHPEVFDHLDGLVKFSPRVRQYFASKKSRDFASVHCCCLTDVPH